MIIGLITFVCLLFIFKHFLKKEDDNIDIPQEVFDIQLPKDGVDEMKNENEILKVSIIEPKIDISKLTRYKNISKKTIFRPQTLDEYIGQDKAKENILIAIDIIKNIKPVHIFIDGRPGTGKTTLCKIVGNMMGAKWIERIASQIKNEEDLINLMNEINMTEEEYVILFLDEIHTLACDPHLLFTVMEDFQLAGCNIRPFTLIGATTQKYKFALPDLAPMLERFLPNIISLEQYNINDVITIVRQAKEKLYTSINISESNYQIIAQNSKLIPRKALGLLTMNLVRPIQNVLNSQGIVKDGLDGIDIKILEVLNKIKKPMGAAVLAQKVRLSKSDYESIYEPYLVEEGYIERTPRREIGQKGIELLEQLKEEKND